MERRVWALLLCTCLLGCAKLGEGDGVRQADQFAAQKNYTELSKLLQYPLASVRARALHHIVTMRSPEAHKALTVFLQTASPLWRQEVLVLLFSSGRQDPQATALLARFCDDTKLTLRLATIAELGHHPRLAPPLWRCMLEGLGDADKSVSRIAHLGLRQQGWRALPILRKALLESKPPLTKRIIRLLIEITVQHWTSRKEWQRWFKSGRAALFSLRYKGQWPQHKAELKRVLAKGPPQLQAEAARLLARLAPGTEGVELLLASSNPKASRWLALWGKAGVVKLRALLKAQPAKVKPVHIRALAAWLDHKPQASQKLLLPYLDPTRPAHSLAAIDVLSRSFAAHHPAQQATRQKLQALATSGPPALVGPAIGALWQAGVVLPQTAAALMAAYRSAPPAQKQRHLDALTRWAAWHKDRSTIDFLIGQLSRTKETKLQLDLLASLAYLSEFASTARAATHAFVMATRKPHVFGVSGFRLLHAQPLHKRYTWLRLLGPKIAPAQWLTTLKALHSRKSLGREQHVAASLLLRALSPRMPREVQVAAARTVAKHRVLACASALLRLLKVAAAHHALPLARALEALKYKPAIPLLQHHFKQSKTKGAKWELAMARWRCGDTSALAWCQRQLKQAKGFAWNAPKRLVPYLLEAKQETLLLAFAPKLKHQLSSSLAALQFTKKPSKASLVRLLKRLHRRVEPNKAKQRAITWLQEHTTPQLYTLVPHHAPLLDKEKLMATAARLLHKLSHRDGAKAKEGTALAALVRLHQDKRLSAKGHAAIAKALQERRGKTPKAAPTKAQHQARLQRAEQALAKSRNARNLGAVAEAHTALAQHSEAIRFYLLALHHSHDVAEQRALSRKMRACKVALKAAATAPTARRTPTSQATSKPAASRPALPTRTRPRPRPATQPGKRPQP